ncbi:helix-turn-helix domain-containing protein [Sinorhizobium medicae]
MRSIADEIKRIREASGLNQKDFAEAIGASQGSVSKWERGLEKPRADMLIRIQGWYDSEWINTQGAAFDFGVIPEIIDIPLTGALLAPSDEDIHSGKVNPIGQLRLPRHPSVKGSVLGWMVPRMEGRVGFKPGSVIFTHSDNLDQIDDGEMVMVRERIHSGKFIYEKRYYGSSDKGFEWFTPDPETSATISLDRAIPTGKREEHDIYPVGIIFALYTYESARDRFWSGVWDDWRAKNSNTNF